MKHVVFHNDVDGIVSAAFFLSSLENTNDVILKPVATSIRGQDFDKMIQKMDGEVYIFDFQYNEKAALWIDHHQNQILGFEAVANDKIVYDCRAKSTAGLVFSHLLERSPVGRLARSLANGVDMVDNAEYPSAEFIFNDKSPIMVLRSYLEFSYPAEAMYCRVVEKLVQCNLDLEKALILLNVDGSYVDAVRQKTEQIKKKLEIYGKISVIRQRYPYQHPRYAENLISQAKYNIRTSEDSANDLRVHIAYNKWSSEKSSLNIGNYASKTLRKGGGHYNVGGGVIAKDKFDDFLTKFSELVERV